MTAGSREAELLLSCARTEREPYTDRRIVDLCQRGIDWDYLLQMSQRHTVTPLLYWHLKDTAPGVIPEGVLVQLREQFEANRLRALFLTRELLAILKMFEEHGIPAIPYKGPTLAAMAYGDLSLRRFGDLDILVRESDVLRTGDLLASLDYKPQYQMSKAQEAAFLKYERQYLYARDGHRIVEAHWTLTPRYISFPLSFEDLSKHAVRVALGGDTVPTFSPEDLMLALSVHGSVHFWERLGWICDIAELVRVSDAINWTRLLETSARLGVKRMLLLGLWLAQGLLGAHLPEGVLSEARKDDVLRALAEEVRVGLFSEDTGPQGLFEGSAFRRFHFQIIESPVSKLRYCVHRATTPTLLDWEEIPLPAAFFPCYRLLRPLRLGGRFGRRLAGRFL